MENRGGADDADDAVKDSSSDGITEDDFAEEFTSDLPSMSILSAPSGSPSYASLQLPSASKVNIIYDRDAALAGSTGGAKKLEHAPPGERMHSPALGMVDSLERPPVLFSSNHGIVPGAFPVRSSRNTATSRTFRSPTSSHDSTNEFRNEESKQEEGVLNSAGVLTGAHHSSRMAAESGLYTVEAQRVPDRNEEGTVMVAEAQHLKMKWYQRRWIYLGLALCACGLAGAVVAMVVFVVRQPSAASRSPSMSPTIVPSIGTPTTPDPTSAPPTRAPIVRATPPTLKPTSVTPVVKACNFLSIPNVTKCRSTVEFKGITTGSTIPSEIGLMTQMTALWLSDNSLTSTIPTEIGLLTQLVFLDFSENSLTSTIPSEIGLLTQLWYLYLFNNELKGTVSKLCSLPSLSTIFIDCGEIECAGCCWNRDTFYSCR